jgi:hypothetical protein
MDVSTMNNVGAIKRYFEAEPFGRKVTMEEMKALSFESREELGRLAKAELADM